MKLTRLSLCFLQKINENLYFNLKLKKIIEITKIENEIYSINNFNFDLDLDIKLKLLSNYVHPFCDKNINLFYEGFNNHFLKNSELIDKTSINVIDVGCGNGIFTILFLYCFLNHLSLKILKSKDKDSTQTNYPIIYEVKLTLLDIDQCCLLNAKYNILKFYEFVELCGIKKVVDFKFSINCIMSNLLEYYKNQSQDDNSKIKFDVVLSNLPQTPCFKNFRQDKLSIIDIKAKGIDGKRFNIEIQISDEADYDKRVLYYLLCARYFRHCH